MDLGYVEKGKGMSEAKWVWAERVDLWAGESWTTSWNMAK